MSVKSTIVELILNATAAGKALLTAANAAAQRTALGLGSLATQSGTFSGTHSGTSSGTNTGDQDLSSYATTSAVAAGYQPLDSDLTTIAGLTATTDSFLQAKAGAWAARTIAQVKTDLGIGATVGDVVGPSSATDNAIVRMDGSTGKLVQNSTPTISDAGAVDVAAATASAIPLTVRSTDNSTTNPIFNVESSNGTDIIYVKTSPLGATTGRLHFGGVYGWIENYVGLKINNDPTTTSLVILNGGVTTLNIGGTNNIVQTLQPIVTGGTSNLGQLTVVSASSSTIGVVVKAAASQSANLTEWQNSSGTVLASVSAAGNASLVGITASTTICAGTYTVATLPSASANTYKFANVSDSLAPTLGATVAAGGSAKCQVWSDGTNWKVCAA